MLLSLTWLILQFAIFTVVGALSIILSLSVIKGLADFLIMFFKEI
ncbi:hypothetical protein [Streptococcus suis]|nr:hypothetical protein [Streptococcus suis]MDS1161631.1 hypothetical protein [Streptococcus suis]